jgi:hypothetical protein
VENVKVFVSGDYIDDGMFVIEARTHDTTLVRVLVDPEQTATGHLMGLDAIFRFMQESNPDVEIPEVTRELVVNGDLTEYAD